MNTGAFTTGPPQTAEKLGVPQITYADSIVNLEGDEIVVSHLEHHANIVPWQMLAEEKGARIRVIPMNDAGELILDGLDDLLTERTQVATPNRV